jgi:hypothetical protein
MPLMSRRRRLFCHASIQPRYMSCVYCRLIPVTQVFWSPTPPVTHYNLMYCFFHPPCITAPGSDASQYKVAISTRKSLWSDNNNGEVFGMLNSRQRQGIFFFLHSYQADSWAHNTPIQWVPKALSWGVKRPGLEGHQSRMRNYVCTSP